MKNSNVLRGLFPAVSALGRVSFTLLEFVLPSKFALDEELERSLDSANFRADNCSSYLALLESHLLQSVEDVLELVRFLLYVLVFLDAASMLVLTVNLQRRVALLLSDP